MRDHSTVALLRVHTSYLPICLYATNSPIINHIDSDERITDDFVTEVSHIETSRTKCDVSKYYCARIQGQITLLHEWPILMQGTIGGSSRRCQNSCTKNTTLGNHHRPLKRFLRTIYVAVAKVVIKA